MAALESAGLTVVLLREPVPDIDDLKVKSHLEHWRRVLLFLWLKGQLLL